MVNKTTKEEKIWYALITIYIYKKIEKRRLSRNQEDEY